MRIVKSVLFVLVLCAAFGTWGSHKLGLHKVPLERYTGKLPFSTMCSFVDGTIANYKPLSLTQDVNTITEHSSYFVPKYIDYSEYAQITFSDGTIIKGWLDAEYFEAKTPELSVFLAEGILRYYQSREGGTDLDIPEIEVPCESVYAYRSKYGLPCILIQKGNVTIHASFLQHTGDHNIPFEVWVNKIAVSVPG